MSALVAAIVATFGKIAEALFGAWFQKREQDATRQDSDQAHERAAAAEAANETQQTIAEVADARSKLSAGPRAPADLARRLRERAERRRAAGRDDPNAGA